MFCNRGIYHKGWTAVTRHSTPVGHGRRRCPPSTTTSGSSTTPTPTGPRRTTSPPRCPTSCRELQRLCLIEAAKYNVLPLDDRRVERFNSDLAGRPTLVKGNSQLLFGGMGRLSENSVLNLKNKSHSVTAEIVVPDGGADGVIIAQGGAFAGWALYLHDGKPDLLLQPARRWRGSTSTATRRSRPGRTRSGMEFAYDGGGLAKGGDVTLYVDGTKVGDGRVDATVADDLLRRRDLRRRQRHRLTGQRRLHARGRASFTGTVNWVQLDVGDDDHDHLITPEERIKVAMARQ